MKRTFNRALAVILSVIMLFGALPFTASATDSGGNCGENLEWSFDSVSGLLSITGSGDMEDYLAASAPWYTLRSKIKTVSVSDGALSIGNNAFSGCYVLESAAVPEGVTDIGINAFRDCASLEAFDIPESVKTLGMGAFYASDIRNINIPASVTEIGANAFGWCASLEGFTVADNNENYYADEFGVLFNKNKTELIKFPNNSNETGYAIPATVEKISDDAFENCASLQTVSLPASVTEIGSGVFFNCGLESIIVDSANGSYSSDEFGVLFNKDKTRLIQYPCNASAQEYQVPASVKEIESAAFHNVVNLKGVALPDGMEAVGDYVFLFCENLEYVHIPASVTEIGEEIADYTSAYICSESASAYAKEYAEANGYTFKVCAVHETGRKVVASGSCGELALWVLYDDGELVISGTGEMADYEKGGSAWADYADSVKKLTVNNGITYISENAFYGCNALENADIPVSVTSFGAGAFGGCEALESVSFSGDTADWLSAEFADEFSNPAYYAQALYIAKKLITDLAVPENISEIGAYTFAGYDNLASVSLDGVTAVGDGAFLGTSVENANLPDGIISIGARAFENCAEITEIIVPDKTESIGAAAFADCTALEYVHIPASVTEIGENIIAETAYICSDSENAYAKEYAEANGCEFRLCKLHQTLGISLSKTKIEILKGSTYKLEAVITPEASLNESVTWSSDNPSVAYVDENGVVSAVSVGKATVTATTVEDGYQASCEVTVSPRTFKVTWISDGTETVDTVAEDAVIPEPSEPVKTGHTFTGWTPAIPEKMPARELVFTATWKANDYVAAFDANGGAWADGAMKKEFSVTYGKKITEPEAPSKQGYLFAGWNSEIGVMDSVDGKEFVAVWKAAADTKYTVNTHIMELDGAYKTTTKSLTGTTDSTVNAEYTVETGFVLNAEKSVLSGAVAPDGSLVLDVYIDRVKSVISINGEQKECLYGETVTEPSKPEAPEGHRQNGWADENGNAVVFPLTVGVDVPSVIKPVFEKLSYTVKWIVDDSETVETYEYQQKIEIPAAPEKHGYIFKGWSPDVPDSMPASNLEFNAEFEKIIYTCPDCGDKFDDEDAYNEHVAYEKAKKAVRVSIKNNPGTAKIKHGETLELTAIVKGAVDGTEIWWYVDGEKSGEGETFSITFKSGTKTVEVKIVDEEGNVLADENGNEISDSQKVTVNASFWQKIVSFFKNLFRINRVVVQSVFENIA